MDSYLEVFERLLLFFFFFNAYFIQDSGMVLTIGNCPNLNDTFLCVRLDLGH